MLAPIATKVKADNIYLLKILCNQVYHITGKYGTLDQ